MSNRSGQSLARTRLPLRVLMSTLCATLLLAACGGSDEPPPPPAISVLAGSGTLGTAEGTGTAAGFNTLGAIVADSAGNYYVADIANHAIRRVTPGGVVTNYAGLPGAQGSDDGTGTTARFKSPYGLAIDAQGNLYVADTGNNTIRKIDTARVVTTIAGTAGQPGATDATGTNARFGSPTNIALDPSGALFITDMTASTVRRMELATGVVTTFAGAVGQLDYVDANGTSARFAMPTGIARDGAGNLYVSDTGNYVIRKITPAGDVTTIAGVPHQRGTTDGAAGIGKLYWPWGIAVRDTGDLYVGDVTAHIVRKISPAGAISTVVGIAATAGWQVNTLPGVVTHPAGVMFRGSTMAVAASHGVVLVTNAP